MKSSGYIRVAVLTRTGTFTVNLTSSKITGGYESPFLNILLEGLQLKPIILVSKEDEWGRQIDDGSWTGLIGMVQRGETDMAISSILVTAARMKVVDYSYPYSIEDVTFATKMPGTVSTAMTLIKPFSLNLWLALFISLFAFPLTFHLLMSKKPAFGKLVFNLSGNLLNQAFKLKTTKHRDRILIGAWFCGSLIISKTYCSFLLSFLTLPIRESGIKDINELAKLVQAGSFRCYTTRGSSLLDGLSQSSQESAMFITTEMKRNNWLLDSDNDVFTNYVNTKNCAIIRTRNYILNMLQDSVFLSDDSFYTSFSAIVLPKGSPLKIKINKLIQQIAESALYFKHLDHHLFKIRLTRNLQKEPVDDFEKISVEDLKGTFIFLFAGYLCAFVVYVFEVIHEKWNQKQRRNIQSRIRSPI